jgi:outer membrane protein assembly factor BamD
MMRRFLPLALGFVLLNSIFLSFMTLSGCSGKPVDEGDAASLYQDAEDEIKSDHYQIAIEKLRVIKNKFPYSKYSLDAQLRIADVLFMQESYAEAAASYETFRDLHPKAEKVGYAMFRVGKAYFLDIPSPISRDLTPAQKALDAYNEYLRRFPKEKESDEARKDVAETRKILAQKELYVGDFYLKRDYLESAKPRFEKILVLYGDTDIAKDARERIEKINKRLSENPANNKGREPVKK